MYAYFDSKPTVNYPENTAADFTIQLYRTISDVKECGVTEVTLPVIPRKPVFLCSDLCVESIVNSETLPVLRRMVGQKTFVPNIVTYVPLRVSSFDTIRFYIYKDSSEQVKLVGETKLTLHLR
jgi:hypothetical protein